MEVLFYYPAIKMNSKEQKLISLLQPKDYKSKIKLYCLDSKFNILKVAQVEKKPYIRQIKIEQL